MSVGTGSPPIISTVVIASVALAERLKRKRDRLQARLLRIENRIRKIQNARLLSGSVFAFAVLLSAFRPHWQIPLPAAAVFAPIFIYLVSISRRWSAFQVKLTRWMTFLERQLARCEGRAPATGHSSSPETFGHEKFASDLDVFGDFSVWTLLDETLTHEGSLQLKSWIIAPRLNAADVRLRQEAVRSLRHDHWFYTRLTLIADRDQLQHSSQQVLRFLNRAGALKTFRPTYALTLLFWTAWIAALAFHLPGASALYLLFLIAHFSAIGRAGEVFKAGVGVSHHLSLLSPVFSAIEERTGKSESLSQIAPVTATAGPSRESRRLHFAVGFLSTSANPILHLAINAALPWSSTGLFLLELARKRLDASFSHCLAELSHLEALFSLVIFDRYQTQTYPSLTAKQLSAKGLFHPLVPRAKVVANDFAFEGSHSLGLLTGSNMSGKSTFLRTVGVNQLLANIGAPVFATEFETRPLTIEPCIEVSDSLRDGFSYFYAEVRRLKAVLEASSRGSVLFLIDEIFRGTNNRERQIGSRAVIRALARAGGSEGFISTHDLELTVLERTEPAVVNLHFREEINEGQMSFTYLLQAGASPTTNALRIMQLEGLPIDDDRPKA